MFQIHVNTLHDTPMAARWHWRKFFWIPTTGDSTNRWLLIPPYHSISSHRSPVVMWPVHRQLYTRFLLWPWDFDSYLEFLRTRRLKSKKSVNWQEPAWFFSYRLSDESVDRPNACLAPRMYRIAGSLLLALTPSLSRRIPFTSPWR